MENLVMKSFWKWMIKRDYALAKGDEYNMEYLLLDKGTGVATFKTISPSKQMLIGYILEYINYKYNAIGKSNPHVYDWRECNIEEIYEGLYLELVMLKGEE